MGVCGDRFQASVRLATTGNFRGEPSSGSALKEATSTNSPACDLRLNGSKNTMSPLASGTRLAMVPQRAAIAIFRKFRRAALGVAVGGIGAWTSISFIVNQGTVARDTKTVIPPSPIGWERRNLCQSCRESRLLNTMDD